MKSRHILIYIFSLLLVSLFSKTVYGDESSQSIGNDNNCPTQIINSNGNEVTCNIYINHPEATSNVNQPNPVPKATESTYSSNPGGYTPIQNSSPEISNSGGYTPIQSPEPQISNSDGYTPVQNPSPQMSTY